MEPIAVLLERAIAAALQPAQGFRVNLGRLGDLLCWLLPGVDRAVGLEDPMAPTPAAIFGNQGPGDAFGIDGVADFKVPRRVVTITDEAVNEVRTPTAFVVFSSTANWAWPIPTTAGKYAGPTCSKDR